MYLYSWTMIKDVPPSWFYGIKKFLRGTVLNDYIIKDKVIKTVVSIPKDPKDCFFVVGFNTKKSCTERKI